MKYGDMEPRDGERIVHNFPVNERRDFGDNGFRYWTESVTEVRRERCYCHWAAVAPEHYSTRHAVPKG